MIVSALAHLFVGNTFQMEMNLHSNLTELPVFGLSVACIIQINRKKRIKHYIFPRVLNLFMSIPVSHILSKLHLYKIETKTLVLLIKE